jgi:hypothetical protein
MRKVALSRRELIALLQHNDFVRLPARSGTSHKRYKGEVGGITRLVDVDDSIDTFNADSHGVLYYIVTSQLRFTEGAKKANDGWARFYSGEASTAKRADVPYRKWS